MSGWTADGFNGWSADGFNGWSADGFQPSVVPPPGPPIPFAFNFTAAPASLPLQLTIYSYLYQQYADDDNLQAFVGAYNGMTQTYLNWFHANLLPIYTQLSGDLLDWVAQGLYGSSVTSLTTAVTSALGPLNTVALNSNLVIDGYIPSSSTTYTISDDVFQRILTWNFYKGDGKRFCMRWIKRRIMRFLLGTNGTDPQPSIPGFIVGAENTQAINVAVSANVLTVSINQILLSTIAAVDPGVLELFQLAFEGGVLDLPLQYSSYVCNIVTSLTALASPSLLSIVGSAPVLTTGVTTISVLAGSGFYTYAWSFLTGGAGISITSLGSPSTSFSAAPVLGTADTGLAVCVVTDIVTSQTTAVTVQVTIARVASVTVSVSPSAVTVIGATATETTPTVSASVGGGAPPYGFAWSFSSGGMGLIPTHPSSITTAWKATTLTPGTTLTGVALVTATDVYGQTNTASVNVTITRASTVAAFATPTLISSTGTNTTQTTNFTTVSPSGGVPPYTFQWIFSGGGTNQFITNATSASTAVTAIGMAAGGSYGGTLACTITDTLTQTVVVHVSTAITCTLIGLAQISWGSRLVGITNYYGFSPTFGSVSAFGALVSSNVAHGTLAGAYSTMTGGTSTTVLAISSTTNLGHTFFTNMVTPFGAATSAAATYTYSGGIAKWVWSGLDLWASGVGDTDYYVNLN